MKTHSLKLSPHSTFNVRCAKFTLALTTPPAARASLLRFPLSVFCFLLFLTHGYAATRYVWQESPSPGPPYDTWATAAHDIQTAVDAAGVGEEIVVTNGVYATGARAVGTNVLVNRVAVDKPLALRSVNGPELTTIEGSQVRDGSGTPTNGIRCVYLADGASLSGFTVTNGFVSMGDGGGLYCESATVVVSNCTLTGNESWYDGGGAYGGSLYNCTLSGNWAGCGGGAHGGTLHNCMLTGNSAEQDGGGAYLSTLNDCVLTGNWTCGLCSFGGGAGECTLYNCTLTGNSAPGGWGGGAYGGTLNNCTLVGNSAYEGGGAYGPYDGLCTLNNCTLIGNSAWLGAGGADGGSWLSTCIVLNNCIVHYNDNGNYDFCCTLNYCCTVPMPWRGIGNLTNAPLFANTNHWSDLRLQPNSPCIDAGNNDYVTTTTDLDGNPRILGGKVDMGAYEFVPPTPATLIEHLITQVNESDLRHRRPLLASLEAALASIQRGNAIAAANQLHAFQNKVRAQVSDPVLAMELIAGAGQVIAALDGDKPKRLAAKLHGLKRGHAGKLELKFTDPDGQVYFVEASTNLLDWEVIGVATKQPDGSFVFDDPHAARFPNRFYRVVNPGNP